MQKRIVLCADDYGQAPHISKGILNLVKLQRLSAVSCMVNTTHWLQHSQWLLQHKEKIDVGLHLNLSEGRALSPEYKRAYGEQFYNLSSLMRRAFLKQLNVKVIEHECRAQIAAFTKAMGYYPNFIDGHQHVHQFPVIRQALINVYNAEPFFPIYFRLINENKFDYNFYKNLKSLIIFLTGTSPFKKLLQKNVLAYNSSFVGIYAFEQAKLYPVIFQRFLKKIKNNGLIMCHPGLRDESEKSDKIAWARTHEYNYLASEQFLIDCANHHIEIKKFFN